MNQCLKRNEKVTENINFQNLFLRRVRTNSVFQTKLLKFLAKGQCTVLYELHVLFIKLFELVGEIELFHTANVIDLLL